MNMTSHWYRNAVLVLFLSAIGLTARADTGPLAGDCTDIAGTAGVITGHRIVMFGELHGTKEMPAMFARLVCAALQRGNAVSVGLELPASEQAQLDQYMASDGDSSARNALLASWFWSKGRDGRQSNAYFGMIEALRGMRHAGLPLSVFSLEDKPIKSSQYAQRRDEVMAARVRHEYETRTDTLVLTYTGNIHNMLHLPEGLSHIPAPMGLGLQDLHPVSINLTGSGGTMWNCSPECGVHGNPNPPAATSVAPTVLVLGGDNGVYSGHIDVGATTASPPAAGVDQR
jgi:hypothetical protein